MGASASSATTTMPVAIVLRMCFLNHSKTRAESGTKMALVSAQARRRCAKCAFRQRRIRLSARPLQQRTQGTNVGDLLEREDRRDQTARRFTTEHRRDEVAGFGNDLVSAHRITDGATDGLDALAKLCAVSQRDLD